MKFILTLNLLVALMYYQNCAPKMETKKESSVAILVDTCNALATKINYTEKEKRFRTIDFSEGKDTFRIVPDTVGGFDVYVQKKTGSNCWKTLEDTFKCRQSGIKLIDENDDGFIDICNILRWWNEISLYNPKTKSFMSAIKVGVSSTLPQQFKYDIVEEDVKSDVLIARLYRFENLKQHIYAVLKTYTKKDSDTFETEKIQLFSVEGETETLLKTWKPTQFPAFMKNNGSYDYFEDSEFMEDYWKKNWKQFVNK